MCTGDGICSEICPDVFTPGSDGSIHIVYENAQYFSDANTGLAAQKTGAHLGGDGLARIPASLLSAAIEAAEECPGECIYFEPTA